MLRRWLVLSLAAGSWLLVVSAPEPAHAGGFEFPAAGTRSLGRGGAFHARADEPLALLYNPANLASLPGLQLQLDAHLVFYNPCFHRDGNYGDQLGRPDSGTRFGSDDEYSDFDRPNVCNGAPPGPVPELVFTLRPIKELGIGIGLVAPAGVGNLEFGSSDGTVSVDGHPEGELPSPARYMLVEQNVLIFYPSVGVGYQPMDELRFGASFGSGIAIMDFSNYGRALAGETFAGDVKTDLHAKDYFVPRVTASVHAIPHDNVDLMLGFTYNGDIEADGDLELVTGAFRDTHVEERLGRHRGLPEDECPDGYTEANVCNGPVEGVTVNSKQPWQIHFGARYADRIHPRSRDNESVSKLSGEVEDPMANERWDIELDVVYERNSRVDSLAIDIGDENGERPEIFADTGIPAPLPERLALPHEWKDQVSMRLGGDWNIIPGKVAARLGFSFESRGVESKYPQLDFLPLMRYGLHAGATFRFGRFDLSIGYAHIFQEDIRVRNVSRGETTEAEVEGGDPVEPAARRCSVGDSGFCTVEGQRGVPQVTASLSGDEPTIVNNGRFTSSFDVVSLGLRYHF